MLGLKADMIADILKLIPKSVLFDPELSYKTTGERPTNFSQTTGERLTSSVPSWGLGTPY